MSIKLNNQKPAILYAKPFNILPQIDITMPIDQYNDEIRDHIETTYVEPMFNPINTNNAVVIHDTQQNTDVTKDMLRDSIDYLWRSTTMQIDIQDQLNEIYRQGILHHTPNDWYFEEQLGVEALIKLKLPLPQTGHNGGKIVQYSPTVDIIPAAKQMLMQNDEDNATNWFANMIGYIHNRPFNNYLLITVESNFEFETFKQTVDAEIQTLQSQNLISTDTLRTFQEFKKTDLTKNLSIGLFMPNNGLNNPIEQQAYSFSRLLIHMMAKYETANPGKLFVQPGNIKQLYFPENIIILNLENYAHAQANDIKKDWDALEKAFNLKKNINFTSNKKLMTADALNRSMSNGTVTTNQDPAFKQIVRSRIKHLSGKPIPAQNLLKLMSIVIAKQTTTTKTENTYKIEKKSYMRPNRRNPDNLNIPGNVKTTKYRPDIHIYLDTSGSISEEQYRDAIMNLIILAKKINCNLYFTSFSHIISETILLKTKNQTIKNIYKKFLTTHKVTGGTNFENVWKTIDLIDGDNRKKGKSKQINFIITDFDYSLHSDKRWTYDQPSLKNTYYVPISTSQNTWDRLLKYANNFIKMMAKAGDHNIRQRLLF